MSELYKLKITAYVKIDESWFQAGRTWKGGAQRAAELIAAKAADFCDPDDAKKIKKELLVAQSQVENKVQEPIIEDTNGSLLDYLLEVDGVDSKISSQLVDAGINSYKDVSEVSEEQLQELDGVGKVTATKILTSAKKLAKEETEEDLKFKMDSDVTFD